MSESDKHNIILKNLVILIDNDNRSCVFFLYFFPTSIEIDYFGPKKWKCKYFPFFPRYDTIIAWLDQLAADNPSVKGDDDFQMHFLMVVLDDKLKGALDDGKMDV